MLIQRQCSVKKCWRLPHKAEKEGVQRQFGICKESAGSKTYKRDLHAEKKKTKHSMH